LGDTVAQTQAVIPFQILLVALFALLLRWLERGQHDVIAFLREENRARKTQLAGRRLRVTDGQRRRLATAGRRLGRALLRDVATLDTPDTILRRHRELIARKWTYARRRPVRPGDALAAGSVYGVLRDEWLAAQNFRLPRNVT